MEKSVCCAVLSHSVVSDSLQHYGPSPARLLCPWEFSRQEYWSGLLCPPPGTLPHPGMEPVFLMSPAWAGRFFPLVHLSESDSVMANSLWLHGLQPTRLLCSWNSSGKNTGVGCPFLLQAPSGKPLIVSNVQQGESAMCIHISPLFLDFLPI